MVWGIISEARSLRASYRTNTLFSNVSAKGLIAHEALGWLPLMVLDFCGLAASTSSAAL